MRYVSKSTEIEAMLWDGTTGEGWIVGAPYTAKHIVAWVSANGGEARYEPGASEFNVVAASEGRNPMTTRTGRIAVRTINGWARAEPGHYVVNGIVDFYPCDPETFEKRWEPA